MSYSIVIYCEDTILFPTGSKYLNLYPAKVFVCSIYYKWNAFIFGLYVTTVQKQHAYLTAPNNWLNKGQNVNIFECKFYCF